MLENIAAAKERPLARIITGLSIRHVGPVAAEALAREFRSIERIDAGRPRRSWRPPTAWARPSPPRSRQWFAEDWHREIVRKWRAAGVRMEEEGSGEDEGPRPLEGLTVVVTGTLATLHPGRREGGAAEPRCEGDRFRFEEDGFVVVGDNPGSKYDKAMQLKVPVLDEDGLRRPAGTGAGRGSRGAVPQRRTE